VELDPEPEDPYLWLEDVGGDEALAWVRRQNTRSTEVLASDEIFRRMDSRFLAILDSEAKIPFVRKCGAHYYNFWRDKGHERGLWRRTTPSEYQRDRPAWETVIDLDALARTEGEGWVWEGANPLPPDYSRCLVSLSRGGADATVVREFDLQTRSFVADGFMLPEAKNSVAWMDRNALLVGTDFGPGSLTASGYPRLVKLWQRGTPLSAAALLYEGRPTDVYAFAYRDFTPGFERVLIQRGMTFFTSEQFLLRDGKPVKIDKPDDAEAGVHREWLLIQLRTDWTAGGRTWPAGALLATRLEDFLAGRQTLEPLFVPAERRSLVGYSATRGALILDELDNVSSRPSVARFEAGRWIRAPIPGLPEFGSIGVAAVDELESDDYFLTVTDFLTPTSLHLGTVGGEAPRPLKQSPAFFDAAGLGVSQHEAVSRDGTRVPYFEVALRDRPREGTAPTLLTGYGGFEVAEVPYHSGVLGSGWLERGGVFVLANIRGGGEFGPRWHQAALRSERPRAYEDFIAVAEDLIRRGVTGPRHLGCMGGSNGGLLVGNMLTRRPDLFGAIVCQAPLLDMRRYSRLLAGASWVGEYGDPEDPEQWAFIRGFSPYHNLRAGTAYPPTLFTGSTRDDRVHPGHARKMAARMQELGCDALFYENVEGGHAGSADNRQLAFMSTLAYAFLWRHLS